MRKLSTLLFLCAIGMPLFAATTVRVKTKLPEGAELHGDVVTLKSGYAFKRIAASKVEIYATSGRLQGKVTGTLTCDCTKGGGCSSIMDGKGYKCSPNAGCTGCTMTLTMATGSKPEVQPVH